MTTRPLLSHEVGPLVAALHDAGRAWATRPLDDRLRLIDDAIAAWLRTSDRLDAAAADVAAATGAAPTMVRTSLERTLAAWRGGALRDLLADVAPELAGATDGERVVALPPRLVVAVLARNTPGLAVAPTLCALALGAAVIVKPPSRDDGFASRLAASLAEIDPGLGSACAVRSWQGGDAAVELPLFTAADRVVAYGSAAAIAAIRAIAGERTIARGPRASIAVVAELRADTARRLAHEVALLDQQGCLSPQAVLVDEGVDPVVLGEALAREFAAVELEWPRRRLDLAEATDFRRAVDEAEASCVAGEVVAVHGGVRDPWAVVVDRRDSPVPSPLHRFVRLHPFAGPEGLRAALAPLRAALECVGIEADDDRRRWLEDACRDAGAARVCTLGAMQDPPAAWQAGGPGGLAAWLTRTSIERSGPPVEQVAAGLRDDFLRHVAQTSEAPRAIEVVHAAGCFVHDRSGRAWLDLLAGIGVASIGHAHPAVARAVAHQAARYTHVMVYGEDVVEPQVRLARRLAALLPESLGVVYFTNSGAEAVEGALKLARKATGRDRVLSFDGAFHGDTTGALALGGNPIYREPFRPLLPGATQIPWNDRAALRLVDGDVAAVFVEPVQAEGGVRIPDPDFLPELRARCTEVGALLVYDEVVTGLGRTGRWFGFEHWPGAVPDVLLLAKSLGGGLPLGAFAASPSLMASLSHDPPLGHVTTFGGNPVCCAASLAALDVLEREHLPERAAAVGRSLLDELRLRVGRGGLVEARGLGLLLGLEFATADDTMRFVDRCRERGLLLGWTLHRDRVVRLAPPLILGAAEIGLALDAIDAALA